MDKEPGVETTEAFEVGQVLEEPSAVPAGTGGDPLLGVLLDGKYQVEEMLAGGGMCTVYRARHVVIDKNVAVKVLLPQMAMDETIAARFECEARAASRFSHPHAIDIIDFGRTPQGLPFIVMDLVVGKPLGAVLRQEGRLSLERACLLLGQICSALDAAHAQGVIHRDLKPDNIMISAYDGKDWVTVVDFGIAKIQEDLHQGGVRTTGNCIFGTPRYMSPEQAEGRRVDARSDIYSLGVMLYEMIVGEAPFTDESSMRVLIQHATEPPPPPRLKRPDLSAEVEAVVLRALAKDPAERPQSAAELSLAFADALSGGEALTVARIRVPLDRAAESPVEAPSLARRRRSPLAAAAVLALALAGGAGYLWLQRSPEGAGLVDRALAYMPFASQPSPAAADVLGQARERVTEARERIESLPQGHALRRELPQLIQWQGELDGYRAAPEPTAEMTAQGQEIVRRAGQLAQEAQSAQAAPKRRQAAPVASPDVKRKANPERAAATEEDEEEMEEEEEEVIEEAPRVLPKVAPKVRRLPPPPVTESKGKKPEDQKLTSPPDSSIQ